MLEGPHKKKHREQEEENPTLNISLQNPGILAAESGSECFIFTITIKVIGRANAFTLCTLRDVVKLGRP